MERLSDCFAEAARSCPDLLQLRTLIADVALELGFHYFALLHHAILVRPSARLVRIDNYPESWVRELRRCGHVADDPVHLACTRTNIGFGWSELDSLVSLDSGQKAILSRSRRHGLGAGFTVPANVPGEPAASCSFAVRVGCELPVKHLGCAELIGAYALSAARRLTGAAGAMRRPRLSRREVECLRLVAMGKTDWEISRIIGVSHETARQYVKRARGAYRVVSRTQLAICGVRDAWITFDDAIPPNG